MDEVEEKELIETPSRSDVLEKSLVVVTHADSHLTMRKMSNRRRAEFRRITLTDPQAKSLESP